MLRKRMVEFLGLEPAVHWLGTRVNRDNVNAAATVMLALATIALSTIAVLQWQTLEKTDTTMRLQQRAFLAPRGLETPDNFRTRTVDFTELSTVIENVERASHENKRNFIYGQFATWRFQEPGRRLSSDPRSSERGHMQNTSR